MTYTTQYDVGTLEFRHLSCNVRVRSLKKLQSRQIQEYILLEQSGVLWTPNQKNVEPGKVAINFIQSTMLSLKRGNKTVLMSAYSEYTLPFCWWTFSGDTPTSYHLRFVVDDLLDDGNCLSGVLM